MTIFVLSTNLEVSIPSFKTCCFKMRCHSRYVTILILEQSVLLLLDGWGSASDFVINVLEEALEQKALKAQRSWQLVGQYVEGTVTEAVVFLGGCLFCFVCVQLHFQSLFGTSMALLIDDGGVRWRLSKWLKIITFGSVVQFLKWLKIQTNEAD